MGFKQIAVCDECGRQQEDSPVDWFALRTAPAPKFGLWVSMWVTDQKDQTSVAEAQLPPKILCGAECLLKCLSSKLTGGNLAAVNGGKKDSVTERIEAP